MKTVLLTGILFSLVFLYVAPRCELGVSAVYEMTHWISFTSVPTPVTVKMLINAESRPYLSLLDARYSPTPLDVREAVVHFRTGDQGQRGLLVTWVIDRPQHVMANLTFTIHETRYVSPSLPALRSRVTEEFLEPTVLYPASDPFVKSVASEISSDVMLGSEVEKARAVYDWIRGNIEYDLDMTDMYDATVVLKERRAVCEGFAYAFSTLCRALDVPARVYYGKMIELPAQGIFWRKHCWAEFWDGANWQPVDPTMGYFGSLAIHPYAHGSCGLWMIDVRSERGMVWPINEDGRVTVSGCGFDWARFVGYRYTAYACAWFIQAVLRVAGAPVLMVGGVLHCWKRKKIRFKTTDSRLDSDLGHTPNPDRITERNISVGPALYDTDRGCNLPTYEVLRDLHRQQDLLIKSINTLVKRIILEGEKTPIPQ